jgi:hypothetical protein
MRVRLRTRTDFSSLEVRPASLDELRDYASAGKLYAVIDACDTPSVPQKAAEFGRKRAVSLYRGMAEEMYWSFAPYLFAVNGEVLEWIAADLWTESWGIFAVADTDLDTVRRHFRRFLLVQSPDGEPWYFRFYDPRVLPPFLTTCSRSDLVQFFGPLRYLSTITQANDLSFFSVRGITINRNVRR